MRRLKSPPTVGQILEMYMHVFITFSAETAPASDFCIEL